MIEVLFTHIKYKYVFLKENETRKHVWCNLTSTHQSSFATTTLKQLKNAITSVII